MVNSLDETRHRAHILLAEDDADMRMVLAKALRQDGYEVTECRNGIELLDHLASFVLSRRNDPEEVENVDAIVSDIRMPGVNGLSILEGVRDYQATPPMILITAFGDAQTHAMARRSGAAAVFDKPFDVDDLLKRLHEIAPQHGSGEGVP